MAYENLCMYCFGEMEGNEICPHCGKDSRAAVPQIQLLPGTPVYNDRFLIGRALGQDANGIVYIAMDTKRGGTIRIREYLPRSCAQRTNDGAVVPIAGMEDAFETGMKKLRASVESVDDPRKRHFYFEENGTAYIAQRKNASAADRASVEDEIDEELEQERGRSRTVLYIAIGAAVVIAAVIGLLALLNSLGSGDTTKEALPSLSPSASTAASWAPNVTASPTPYATATFAPLKDPELSWMDYTYSGDVNQDYNNQTGGSNSSSGSNSSGSKPTARPTGKPTILDTAESKGYTTISSSSSKSDITKLQQYLANLGWLDQRYVNGTYNSATKQAVRDFQTYVNDYCSPAEKLVVDGIAGKKTQQWLLNSSISLRKPAVTASPYDVAVDANSSRADIRAVQRKLIALGIMKEGSADGIYGVSTKNAVKNFQSRVNQLQGYDALEVSGVVDVNTMAFLNYYIDWWEEQQTQTPQPTSAPTPAPTATPTPAPTSDTINAWSSAKDIGGVQNMLAKLGLLSERDVDGVYGNRTVDAVKTFQYWVNDKRGTQTLVPSGECDALTRAYLEYCIQNNIRVIEPTAAPTTVPTATPTIAPTTIPTLEPTAEPTVEPTQDPDEGKNVFVDASSDPESIAFVQEMLRDIGLLSDSDIDGDYGRRTVAAVGRFQQYVNEQMGRHTLDVTGICDNLTLQYLEQYQGNGWQVPGEATAEPTMEPTAEPTIEPTVEPTPEPTAEPIGRIDTVNIDISGGSADGGVIALEEGDHTVRWSADGDVQGYYLRMMDSQGNVLREAGPVSNTEFSLPTSSLTPGEVYTLQVGALPVNGAEADVVWQNVQFTVPLITPEPTAEPTPEPTAKPVGRIDNLNVAISGSTADGGVITLDEGDHAVRWSADGDVQGYYLRLLDAQGNSLREAGPVGYTEFNLSTADFAAGEVYTLQIGALPVNGTDVDIVWQNVQFVIPLITPEPTAEPTPEPTAEPTVSNPVINIGASAYQQDGVQYLTSDPTFTWSADGDVAYYDVTLVYQDGTSYPLGETNDTSRTVPLSQMPAGLYKLYVTAYAVGGQNSATSESLFGIPAAEPDPTEVPVPDVTAEPTQPGWEQPQIEYLDPDSDPEAIRYVQLRLYQEGLLRVDDMQEGVLDYATLSAIAAFQQRANELYGLNLTVIDPTVDNIVDFETLTALFQTQGA